jgi:hypothetical protein
VIEWCCAKSGLCFNDLRRGPEVEADKPRYRFHRSFADYALRRLSQRRRGRSRVARDSTVPNPFSRTSDRRAKPFVAVNFRKHGLVKHQAEPVNLQRGIDQVLHHSGDSADVRMPVWL